jgi:hypothetical protein
VLDDHIVGATARCLSNDGMNAFWPVAEYRQSVQRRGGPVRKDQARVHPAFGDCANAKPVLVQGREGCPLGRVDVRAASETMFVAEGGATRVSLATVEHSVKVSYVGDAGWLRIHPSTMPALALASALNSTSVETE